MQSALNSYTKGHILLTDTKEIEKKLRKLEKSLPKTKKPKSIFISKKKVSFFLKVQALIVTFCISSFIFFTFLPPFFWPLRAPITSGFLFRLKPESKNKGLEIHHGIDLGAPKGTRISPSSIGIVTTVKSSPVLGNYVIVTHLFGFTTLYAHLESFSTIKGSIVFPGISKIGFVGSTGRSTGNHLHFSIRFLGIALPPEVFLLFHSIRIRLLKF